jgi:DNA-binding SARP family transcriptional activator
MSTHTWIERERLLERCRPARVVLLSAPGGWGKTTFASQLLAARGVPVVTVRLDAEADEHVVVATLRRALRRAGMADLADTARGGAPDDLLDALLGALAQRSEQLALHIDEAQRLTTDAAVWMRSLIDDLPAPHTAVIAGRSLDRILLRRPAHGWARLEVGDLRFTDAEIGRVIGDADPELCRRVLARTDGWPAAVGLAASADIEVLDGSSPHMLDRLADDVLGDERARLAPVGTLPFLDQTTVDLVAGPGAFEALIGSGLPLRRVGRWWVLADPLREALAGDVTIASDAAAAAAARYDLPTGSRFLLALGQRDAAAEMLAAAHWTELDQFGPRELAAIVDDLGESRIAHHPRILLNAARSTEVRDPELRISWIERGLSLTAEQPAVAFELRAERIRDAVRRWEPDVDAQALELLAEIPDEARLARARALLAYAIANAFHSTPERLAEADRALTESAAMMQLLGEPRWQAEALARLAFMVSYHGGRIALAAEQQAAALALLRAGTRDWALGMTYYSDILDTLGRSPEAEAAASESFEYGRRVGDPVSIGFGAWSLAIVFAHRNDLAGTRRWLDEAERSPGNWVAEVQGREFLAFGSDLLAGLGDRDGAYAYRARLLERLSDEGTQDLIDVVDGRLEAMFGDPGRAIELFDRLDGEPYATIRTKWVRTLFRALSALRLGERAEATRFVERCLEIVETMGLPDLPFRHEPTLVAMLTDVWPGGAQSAEATARVVTLGGFSVIRGTEPVTPAPGHPATLVKLLALRGQMTSEQMIDQLWPEVDTTTGRARLRNLLNRVRGQSGELVGRNGEVLTLLPDVTVDVERFDQLVEGALAGAPGERPGLARVAMAAYGGELLPGDAYEDWAAGPRERLRRRYLSLVDIVADDALARADLDEAMRLLDMAIEHEPLEESRYVVAAHALLAGGRRTAAREVVDRAAAALAEIGVEIGSELAAVGRAVDVH